MTDKNRTENGFVLFAKAVRAPFLTAAVMPVLIGGTLPFWLRPAGWSFTPWIFVETILGVLFFEMGGNLLNGYYDYVSGADQINKARGYSGGSGLINDGVLPASYFLKWGIVFLALGSAVGIHLSIVVGGWFIPVIGAIGLFFAYFYTAPPLKLGYRGFGEIAIALSFGIMPVLGAYYLQVGSVSWRVLLASLPITFAIVLILWVNEVVDIEPDRSVGKMNLVARMGHRAAGRGGVLVLGLLTFGSLFAAVFTASLIPLTLVSVLAFGLIRTIVVDCWMHHGEPRNLGEAQSAAMKLHLSLGIIIAASALAALGS